MKQRERILLLVTASVLVLYLGIPRLKTFFWGPITDANKELNLAFDDQTAANRKMNAVLRDTQLVAEWRSRSFPNSSTAPTFLYSSWLAGLADVCGINVIRNNPETSSSGDVYKTVPVMLEMQARHSQLARFLHLFHQTDLAHRVKSLEITSAATEGDPMLHVVLTAEGIAVSDAPKVPILFPRTNLIAEFKSETTEKVLEVGSSEGFPKEPGFRIRLGNELLNVVKADGNKWTVIGGVEGTSTSSYGPGDEVELAPVHSGYVPPDENRDLMAGMNPFVKPAPPHVEPPPRVVTPPTDKSAEETAFTAYFNGDGQPVAWLHRRSNSNITKISPGMEIDIGGIKATVVDVQPGYVDFERDDKVWRLDIGDTLNNMRARPEAPAPAATEIAETAATLTTSALTRPLQ
jgi:hypothetical protein